MSKRYISTIRAESRRQARVAAGTPPTTPRCYGNKRRKRLRRQPPSTDPRRALGIFVRLEFCHYPRAEIVAWVAWSYLASLLPLQTRSARTSPLCLSVETAFTFGGVPKECGGPGTLPQIDWSTANPAVHVPGMAQLP